MQNKTQEWSQKWDALHINKNTNSGKFLAICTLLTKYSKSDHSGNFGMMLRFLSGNWNSTYGKEVAIALQNAGIYTVQEEYPDDAQRELRYAQKIRELMIELTHQIDTTKMNQDGDFTGLINTIELKTGYSFYLIRDRQQLNI